ncbi:nitrilase [Capsaspora owczarzaki ATCC 30864]|uniref:Nitrilase n=2 Tax=Capsaspora owczarzaki (strain ATCC 30864) TaxID=595528 RepID=A0A0D2WUJ5_CAPO3|nr:nitrilase [Capsaspora owczarzaki ATCC 30864]
MSTTATAPNPFKIALVQMLCGADKQANLDNAASHIETAADNGAKLVILPECFNSPYGTKFFPEYAEPIPGPSTSALAAVAKKRGIYLIGGSIPERDQDKLYNTSTVFDTRGELIAKHRKVHLFDIDVPGKIRFQESETLTAGNALTVVETEFCKIGLAICYDIRFPELALLSVKQGCKFLVYPGAFNMTTGPMHWELLARARAVDNQAFVAVVSPARDVDSGYVAWGHSTVVNPWGDIVAKTDHTPGIVYADIDLSIVDAARSAIPVQFQKRTDMYKVELQQ